MEIFSYFKDLLSSAPRQLSVARGGKGQGLVEYALILVLVAIVVIVILGLIGTNVNDVFNNIAWSL